MKTGTKAVIAWSVFTVGYALNQTAPAWVRLLPLTVEQRWWVVGMSLGGLVLLVGGGVMGLVYGSRVLKEWAK